MKNIISAAVLSAALFFGCSHYQAPPPPPPPAPQPVAVEGSYQTFYDELSPYGRWIDYPNYGYVWLPNAEADFQPYSTNGHWVYSDAGWTWVSDYPWGWAAFHYGRWFYEDGYGWMWMPGNEWAPSWVTWGQSGGYYGWAPLGPNIHVGMEYTPPARAWVFVPQGHVTDVNVHNYVVNRTQNVNIVKNVTVINNVHNSTTVINNNNTVVNNRTVTNNNAHSNVTYNMGPHINEVEKVTSNKVQVMNINENNKPSKTVVNNNRVNIYRPVIKQQQQQTKPAPQKIEPYHQGGGAERH